MRDPEFEDRLRGAIDQLPRPTDEVTRMARHRALSALGDAAAPRARSRSTRRGVSLAAAALMTFCALAGFAVGRTSAPDLATRKAQARLIPTGGPGFVPARGWNTMQTAGPLLGPGGSASAATVPLLDTPRAFPHATIASLGRDDVLIRASLYGRADFIRPVWATYPPRTLPLRTPHGDASASWEGGSGWRYVVTARVDGWLLEVVVYFGAQPSAAARLRADEELRRLLLPSPCPAAQPIVAGTLDRAAKAVSRMIPSHVDTSVRPPVDYRAPRIVARRAGSGDTIPTACRRIPAERVAVVDVRYPHASGRPGLARRTYLVSRQGGRDVVWARTR